MSPPASPLAPAPLPGSPAGGAQVIDRDANGTPRQPLHIAFALGGTDLGRSGIGVYVREVLPPLITRLEAEGGTLTAFGHASEIAAYAPVLAGARERRAPVCATPAAVNAFWHLARAGRFARRTSANVLLLPAANRRIALFAGFPIVAVVHDLAQLRVRGKYGRLRMLYFRRVLLPAFRRPARLVAVSRATRDDLVETLRLPADRVRVVHNGVNTGRFHAMAPDSDAVRSVRAAWGLDRKPYLLYPARLEHPGKNHVRLIRAFARSGLAETRTLALSGADWGGAAAIRSAVGELRLDGDVRLLGFVPGDELPALVAGADALLMLGLHEGFGLPALEGLSAGRPVCVANTGALPEVIGPLGLKCDPFSEDAIARALTTIVHDESIRTRCRLEGPPRADQFSWTRTAQGLLDACHEALVSRMSA